ncbi:MAG: DUF1848 domain-containing protein [Firmicutes bacterium]|nr:DUF1848 domain-containing protein [Bacillota bacterium]
MLLQTGQRTDIPAFYSTWFMNRIREGYVLVRNPYYPSNLIRYEINPQVIDLLGFCTKNPHPMLEHMEELIDYKQFWFVTLTPYGKDIEPNVPDKHQIIKDIQTLSKRLGSRNVVWRYDPIFVSKKYSIEYHLHAFETIAKELEGYVESVVVSFIDLYNKVVKNFSEVKEVSIKDQEFLIENIVRIATKYNMKVRMCAEGTKWEAFGADCSGCFSKTIVESLFDGRIKIPSSKTGGRKECACLITGDIGEYNTCMHLCRYCYANYSKELVMENYHRHDPNSPLLIGNIQPTDTIRNAQQSSWLIQNEQISLF